jgi:putative oxidoreductase
MFVAYFIAHSKDPFQVKQIALVFLILSIVIFLLGSGKYSMDKLIQKINNRRGFINKR